METDPRGNFSGTGLPATLANNFPTGREVSGRSRVPKKGGKRVSSFSLVQVGQCVG